MMINKGSDMTAISSAQSRYDFFLEQLIDYTIGMHADYVRWDASCIGITLNQWHKAYLELEALKAGLEG